MPDQNNDKKMKEDKPPVKVTPLPMKPITVLAVILLTDSICTTMLVPFVVFFVVHLLGIAKEDAGYVSGFLIGLYMLGQVISSKFWGTISDTYGRKFALISGSVGAALCVTLFGLLELLHCVRVALPPRSLRRHGPRAKTVIVDLTDATNQSKGFAIVSMTWGVGTLIGPTIGGFLYDPVNKPGLSFLHLKEDGFLARYPAFLPTIVVSAYCVFSSIFTILQLPETNKKAIPIANFFRPSMRARLLPLLNLIQPALPNGSHLKPIAEDVVVVADSTMEDPHEQGGGDATALERAPAVEADRPKMLGYKQLYAQPRPRQVMNISMIISVPDMLYAEVMPLWAAVSYSSGGINLTDTKIATIVLLNCFPSVCANLAFAKVLRSAGKVSRFWIVCQLLYGVTTFMIAFACYTGTSVAYWYTLLFSMIRKVVEAWTFAIMMIAVADVAEVGQVGSMYAVQQGLCCVVRCIVPFIGSIIFAWSIHGSHMFPFNHFLCFTICLVSLLISAYLTLSFHLNCDKSSDVDSEFGGDVHNSAHHSVQTVRSFLDVHDGKLSEEEPRRFMLNNSFDSLARAFATNIVPGLLQPTILPTVLGSTGPTYNHARLSANSRGVSSGDDSDVDEELRRRGKHGFLGEDVEEEYRVDNQGMSELERKYEAEVQRHGEDDRKEDEEVEELPSESVK
ncbi:transporter-like protein [Strigomonas culicis]|uniref:Transporter-like protein n=1 Tax=Strigomonas culicis TaxID=28005 RepID=S9UK31_9TRYP|nr:transporter-like protein [Strigomonas culicis]|eukprot:EPY29114.1 transporter-like protein [Strigomonas culicis]